MGFNITQIINSVLPVIINGSKNKSFIPISATTTNKSVTLPFTTTQLTIINDGTDNLNVAFDGKSSITTATTITNSASSYWTFNGTWSSGTFSGYSARYTGTANTSYNAVIKPNLSGILGLTLGVIKGQSCAIAKIELSQDNGATWKNPSDIVGVGRSDGAVGTTMNTYDTYANVGSMYDTLTYYLPYDTTSIWAMRVSPTNTQNPSAGTSSIFVVDMTIIDGKVLTIYSKESFTMEIKTTQISYSSPTSVNARVIAI